MMICVSVPAQETDKTLTRLFGQSVSFHEFFDSFQLAAKNNDRNALLDLIEYPLYIQTKPVRLLNRDVLDREFATIFNEQLLNIVRTQDYEQLQITTNGVGFGHGDLWFGGVCEERNCEHMKVRIIRLGRDPVYDKSKVHP